MIDPTPILLEVMDEKVGLVNGLGTKKNGRSRAKFAAAAGAAALALTLSACSSGPDNAATEPTPNTETSEIASGNEDSSTTTTQPSATDQSTTSLIDIPLDDADAAVDLDALPEPEEPELSEPAEAVAEVTPEIEQLADDQAPLDALNEVAKQTTTTAPPDNAKRDGYTRNDAGQLVVLDEPPSLACAEVEIGITALDEGNLDAANNHITSASSRAGTSENKSIASWQEPLATASKLEDGSVAVLVGFIATCAEGGYEI